MMNDDMLVSMDERPYILSKWKNKKHIKTDAESKKKKRAKKVRDDQNKSKKGTQKENEKKKKLEKKEEVWMNK